jgi:hypothetical protein
LHEYGESCTTGEGEIAGGEMDLTPACEEKTLPFRNGSVQSPSWHVCIPNKERGFGSSTGIVNNLISQGYSGNFGLIFINMQSFVIIVEY